MGCNLHESFWLIELFWVAPEHLTKTNLERASLKGDIYSFAMILYEVALRCLPYSLYDSVTPEGNFSPFHENIWCKLNDKVAYSTYLPNLMTWCGCCGVIWSLAILEIIAKVASRSLPPFRPEVHEESTPLDIRQLMHHCWSDDPDDRPDFPTIKLMLRRLMK